MFLNADGISCTLQVDQTYSVEEETYTYSSLLVYRKRQPAMILCRKSLLLTLLLICGDIESCPGPTSHTFDGFTKARGINVFHQNIRGLFQNLAKLSTIFESNKKVNIFSLSETHIVNGHPLDVNDLYQIPGYTFEKRNQTNGLGDGVTMYISNSLKFIRRFDLEHKDIECIWIEIIQTKAKNIDPRIHRFI